MSRHRDRSTHKGEKYVQMYPTAERWIKQCVRCQTKGYDPEMPDNGKYVYAIRKYFPPLALNELGLCILCNRGHF